MKAQTQKEEQHLCLAGGERQFRHSGSQSSFLWDDLPNLHPLGQEGELARELRESN
jgi:hypothetical protein